MKPPSLRDREPVADAKLTRDASGAGRRVRARLGGGSSVVRKDSTLFDDRNENGISVDEYGGLLDSYRLWLLGSTNRRAGKAWFEVGSGEGSRSGTTRVLARARASCETFLVGAWFACEYLAAQLSHRGSVSSISSSSRRTRIQVQKLRIPVAHDVFQTGPAFLVPNRLIALENKATDGLATPGSCSCSI